MRGFNVGFLTEQPTKTQDSGALLGTNVGLKPVSATPTPTPSASATPQPDTKTENTDLTISPKDNKTTENTGSTPATAANTNADTQTEDEIFDFDPKPSGHCASPGMSLTDHDLRAMSWLERVCHFIKIKSAPGTPLPDACNGAL